MPHLTGNPKTLPEASRTPKALANAQRRAYAVYTVFFKFSLVFLYHLLYTRQAEKI